MTSVLDRTGPRRAGQEEAFGWGTLLVVLAGTFMTFLDFFIVNVALPSMQADLHAGPAAVQLVVAGYGVERGLAEYQPNPAHRRAKLVAPTPEGRAALSGIDPARAALAARLSRAMGKKELADALASMRRLSSVLDALIETGAAHVQGAQARR
jgi:MFS family permease